MKAAVLHRYDTALTEPDFVVLEEVPEPELVNDTDVLVRIGGAGVCRTDLLAKKAAAHLGPGEKVVVIGVGGLGHIGIQQTITN